MARNPVAQAPVLVARHSVLVLSRTTRLTVFCERYWMLTHDKHGLGEAAAGSKFHSSPQPASCAESLSASRLAFSYSWVAVCEAKLTSVLVLSLPCPVVAGCNLSRPHPCAGTRPRDQQTPHDRILLCLPRCGLASLWQVRLDVQHLRLARRQRLICSVSEIAPTSA